jgi:hypothetical protein
MNLRDQIKIDNTETFLRTEEFAKTVEYIERNGYRYPIKAIFDSNFLDLDDGNSTISTTQPKITISDTGLRNEVQNGDMIKIGAITYSISKSEPDGTGIIDLFLTKR